MTDYKPLNNLAYEYLRSMIYQCEFEFRKIYSETKLAAQIEVSRTPMRDALNRLAQERYIDILPNRGFTLHIPTREDAAAAYHLRLMTESYCAEIVRRDYPKNGSRETLEKMEDALRQQQRLLENDDAYSIGHFWLDDLSFHKALLEHLNISALVQHYESIMYIFMPHHLIRDQQKHGKDEKVLERHRSTITEHGEIIRALKTGETADVQNAVQAHIETSMTALYQKISAEA